MPPSLLSLLLLAAPLTPDLSARAAELTANARAHHAAQEYEQAANAYIVLSSLPTADEDAALHQAHLNLELAHATTGERAHLCRALDLARRRLGGTSADDPQREAWEEAVADDLAELARSGGTCPARPPRVDALVDPPPVEPAPGPAPHDQPHPTLRSQHARTAAGITLTSMGLAFAGLMGGALIALDRHVDALHRAADVPDGYIYPTNEQDALRRLHADTKLAQSAAIGLGIASAATLATGIGLLASRRRIMRPVALLPSAGPQGGALTLRLRF